MLDHLLGHTWQSSSRVDRGVWIYWVTILQNDYYFFFLITLSKFYVVLFLEFVRPLRPSIGNNRKESEVT